MRVTRTVLLTLTAALPLAACGDGLAGPGAISALPRELSAEEIRVIQASNAFAVELLRESVAAQPDTPNVFLSPLSASLALGMTMNGADGATWTQMRDMLGFDGMEEQEVNEAYRGLIDLLLSLDSRVALGLGNSVWTREGYPILGGFYERARTYFDAETRELDFGDPAAPDSINAWVREATRDRIDQIIVTIPPNAVMFILNAVYFKGDWARQFDPRNTTTAPFTLAGGGTVSVPLMRQSNAFRSFRSEGAAGVELPYGGGAFTAVAVLPTGDRPLAELLAGLDSDRWSAWMALLDSAAPQEVMVALPRFELEYEQILDPVLRTLGMVDAFTGEADFSRLVAGGGVWVDEVKQKTFVKVDEKGTEAAAATSVTVVESAPPELRFDRPFLFAIRERISGTILFLGVIGDPTA